VRWYETQDGRLVIEDLDQDAVLLLWVSERFRVDLRILLFLFEKYGKDLWFFFYMFAGLEVRFPDLGRFLKVVKDVQGVMSGRFVNSAAGKFAKEVLSKGRVELNLLDKRRFPLGWLGLYEEGRDDREGFVEEVKREAM
jgi:hypothetical protein